MYFVIFYDMIWYVCIHIHCMYMYNLSLSIWFLYVYSVLACNRFKTGREVFEEQNRWSCFFSADASPSFLCAHFQADLEECKCSEMTVLPQQLLMAVNVNDSLSFAFSCVCPRSLAGPVPSRCVATNQGHIRSHFSGGRSAGARYDKLSNNKIKW